jgi:hypothetical protein
VTTIRKISLTVLIAGLVAGVAAFGAFSAFSATTSNTGNSFASGTVAIGDNDGASAALYTSANNKPGTAVVSCIRVTYTGSLASQVKLYASTGITGGAALNLKVERGTQTSPSFPSCTGFTPDSTDYTGAGAGVVYDGTLADYPASYGAGVPDAPGAVETWTAAEHHSYRLTVSLADSAAAQGLSSTATFTWEARPQ